MGSIFQSTQAGRTVAILGESGSGKSVTCMSLTRLLPEAPTCTVSGEILFEGKNVLEMDRETIRGVRGNGIAYIFQEASASLNPVFTVGHQIAEAVKLHRPRYHECEGARGGVAGASWDSRCGATLPGLPA